MEKKKELIIGLPSSKKQENKKQPTLSRFLITINTNQKDEKYIPLLRDSYQHFYDNIQDYLKFEGGIDKRTAMKQVHSYEGDCGIEIGGKQKRVHLHALVIFEHNTKLQLDQTKIRSYFCDALDLKSIHLDIKICIFYWIEVQKEAMVLQKKSLKWIDEHYDTYTETYDSDSEEEDEVSKRSPLTRHSKQVVDDHRYNSSIKEEKVSLSTLQEGLQLHLPSLTIIAEFNQVYVLCPTADLQDQYAFIDKKFVYINPTEDIKQYPLADLPVNDSLHNITRSLAVAHSLYVRAASSVVLIIVQPDERNIWDQKSLEYALWAHHKVKMIRRSLVDINVRATLGPETHALWIDGHEISVAYYRAGYTPNDYPTDGEWAARLLIERSLAIKSPSIANHLAKKIQQAIAKPGLLESLMEDEVASARMRSSFSRLYSLSSEDIDPQVVAKACATPSLYVMKLQRSVSIHSRL
eukprot:gene4976-5787_t